MMVEDYNFLYLFIFFLGDSISAQCFKNVLGYMLIEVYLNFK